MNARKQIAQLVAASLTRNKLDPRKIEFVAKKLPKKQLRLYYQAIVRKRKEEKVLITTAVEIAKPMALRLQKLFVQKDVSFTKDAAILAGFEVVISDFVFRANLREYLSRVKNIYENN